MRPLVFGEVLCRGVVTYTTAAWCVVCRSATLLRHDERAPVCPCCGLSDSYTLCDPDARAELPN